MKVQIEKLVYGGEGLARHDGRVIFVPFVLPGEVVDLVPPDGSKKIQRALPDSWKKTSPERQEPKCPVFAQCGGCHYQHISYAQQLEVKQRILHETIFRTGGIEWKSDIDVVSAEPWNYRNRTQMRVQRRDGEPRVGFHAAGSHRVIATDQCPINSPKLNEVHQTLIQMASEKPFPRFLREIEFFTNEEQVQVNVLKTEQPLAKKFFEWCAERIDGFAQGAFIDYKVGDDVFRVGSRSFFQVNRFLTHELSRLAVGETSGELAVDLYSGVGLMTLPLARRFKRVIAVDASPPASRSLHFNLERAGLEAHVVNLDVDKSLKDLHETPDLVVADPPRAGLGGAVTTQLVRLKPKRLHLVSCDPATLGRDLKALVVGGFQLDSLTLVDLFPQTFHIETIAVLSCGESPTQ